MPYKLKKFKKGYKVCKSSGKCFSKKPLPRKRAEAQRKAIYANESITFVKIIEQILSE
jgi:hypothetical protein